MGSNKFNENVVVAVRVSAVALLCGMLSSHNQPSVFPLGAMPCLVESVFKSFYYDKVAAEERGVSLWIWTWDPESSTTSCLALPSLCSLPPSTEIPHGLVPSLSTLPALRPKGQQSAGWPALPSHVTGMSIIYHHFGYSCPSSSSVVIRCGRRPRGSTVIQLAEPVQRTRSPPATDYYWRVLLPQYRLVDKLSTGPGSAGDTVPC